MFHPSRGGVRGGQDQFSWEDVKEDKYRENYLGHSVKAPVGRWQKGKDLLWYEHSKEAAEKRAEELRAIKEAEADAMAEALGLPKRNRGSNISEKEIQNIVKKSQDHSDEEATESLGRGLGFKQSGRLTTNMTEPANVKEQLVLGGVSTYSKNVIITKPSSAETHEFLDSDIIAEHKEKKHKKKHKKDKHRKKSKHSRGRSRSRSRSISHDRLERRDVSERSHRRHKSRRSRRSSVSSSESDRSISRERRSRSPSRKSRSKASKYTRSRSREASKIADHEPRGRRRERERSESPSDKHRKHRRDRSNSYSRSRSPHYRGSRRNERTSMSPTSRRSPSTGRLGRDYTHSRSHRSISPRRGRRERESSRHSNTERSTNS